MGWDQASRNADEVAKIAYNEGVTWVAIHGRTRAQGYSGEADWNYIGEVKSKAQLPILGNGDILTAGQAVNRLKQSECDGVLIGRGCLKNPLIFAEALSLWQGEKLDSTVERDYVNLYRQLHEVLSSHCDERIIQIQLKKFASWYATGFPGAAQFRKTIFQAKTEAEIVSDSLNFFAGLKTLAQADTSQDGFLMGGHG
jgi:tRNA-dihydrouridine synthase